MKKPCAKCGIEKPLTEFHKNNKSESGRTSKCKSCVSAYDKSRHKDNREGILKRKREYYQNNKENHYAVQKKWRAKNKVSINTKRRERNKHRYDTDPAYRTECCLRAQTLRLKEFKSEKSIVLIGRSPKEFWEMNGCPSVEELKSLHIDHVIPFSWFDLENEDHVKVATHYTNLQYLSNEENKSKSDTYAGSPLNVIAHKDEFDIDAHVIKTIATLAKN